MRNSSSWSPWPAGRILPVGATAVRLLEADLEDQALGVAELPGDPREVDEDVVALGDGQADARGLDRSPQEVAVLADHEEREALAEVVRVREEELEEPRGARDGRRNR